MPTHQWGVSSSGLIAARLRDLDIVQKRDPLPSRALPDSVRAALGFIKKAPASSDTAASASASTSTGVENGDEVRPARKSLPAGLKIGGTNSLNLTGNGKQMKQTTKPRRLHM